MRLWRPRRRQAQEELTPNVVSLPSGRTPRVRTIVLAVGRTEPGPRSLDRIASLSRQLEARVLVVSVLERDIRWSGVVDLELTRIASDKAGRCAARLAASGVYAETLVVLALQGNRAKAVCHVAGEYGASLVAVVESRAWRLHAMLGLSLGYKLMGVGRYPVLVIPGRERIRPGRRRPGLRSPNQLEISPSEPDDGGSLVG